ncbi:MAG: hypothetical protein ACQCN4_11550 [Candidatus Bathyarchaeia archaeon]|jgi:hypothetical protein
MIFPLSVSDIGLWLAITALILIVTSELLYSSPNLAPRIILNRRILRLFAVGCGFGFMLTVLMRVVGMG